MTKIIVSKQWAKQNKDIVIYNYLGEKKEFTVKELQEDLQKRYDIILTISEVEKIIEDYVRKGVLSIKSRCSRNGILERSRLQIYYVFSF